MKELSIIIPAYNVEKYIRKCLDSVINIPNTEIIVINDGSTDNTLDIIKEYNDIKIINNANHGVSYSRNYGIKESSGKYIMFVDSDDYIDFDINKYNLNDFNYDIVYFNRDLINITNKEDLYDYICGLKTPVIAGPYCKLIKADFVKENKIFFNENIINGEDMLFNIKCINKAKTFKIVNNSIYRYRQVIGSVTKTFNKKIIRSDLNFHGLLKEYLDESNLSNDNKNKIILYSILNGIMTLIDRMSYIDNYKDFKKNLEFLDKEPYSELKKINVLKAPVKKKKKIILFLVKN